MPEMSGREIEALRNALLDAFDQASFDQMLLFQLDKSRAAIVADGAFRKVTFDLIQVARREGWALDLIRAAREYNPTNPVLQRFCAEHPRLYPDRATDPKDSQPAITQPPKVNPRAEILDLFGKLKTHQFGQLYFLLAVPPQLRPADTINHELQKNAMLRWAMSRHTPCFS